MKSYDWFFEHRRAERYKRVLEMYANPDNWIDGDDGDCWDELERGWEPAQRALSEEK